MVVSCHVQATPLPLLKVWAWPRPCFSRHPVARAKRNGETVRNEMLGVGGKVWERDCASHELCRRGHRHASTTRTTPGLVSAAQQETYKNDATLPHARSICRRNRRGSLHAILSGDRLCGECSPSDFLLPFPRSASFTHFSFALTNKGRARDSSKPRVSCALCGTNATMLFETSTLARSKLAPVPRRSIGGKQRRVIQPPSLHILSVLTSIADG
jgi:hypothetical protein